MEANEKTFRHSTGKLIMLFFGVLLLGILAFSIEEVNYFFFLMTGFLFVIALFYALSSVRISNDEITTIRLFGSKSLRWPEIAHVSTFGQTVRLHNYDDDLVLTLDSQLDGYTDILDTVFSKRPDLLDKNDDRVMSISWLGVISTWGVSIAVIAIGIFQFLEVETVGRIFSLIYFVIGMSIIAKWLLSPKSLNLENKDLTVGYWFKEVSHSARDIDHISLEKQRTRNGYIYFTQITLTSGKKIKLPRFKQGTFLTYQILKRWHKKAVSS